MAPPYLHELALLYLAVAYGADDDLTDEELGLVVDKLHDHEPALDLEVIRDLAAEALEDVMQRPLVDEVVSESLDQLDGLLAEGRREDVLDDLAVIARADEVVKHAERKILRSVERRWQLEIGEEYLPRLLVEIPERGWTLLHDLALLYLAIAEEGDQELSAEEVDQILSRLELWHADLNRKRAAELLEEAGERLLATDRAEAVESSLSVLYDALDEGLLRHILYDLKQVAFADGVYDEAEANTIGHVMRAWDMALGDMSEPA